MNRHIQAKMFTTPVTIFITSNKDSAGDRTVISSYSVFGYVYDSMKLVTNELGEQEISKRQIYLPLDAISDIKTTYLVTCLDSTQQRIIGRNEYRGPRSITLMGVLYLP